METASSSSAEKAIRDLLAQADIRVNGGRAWDLRVHEARFFGRVLSGGVLAFGESYMDGWWDCEALDELSARAVRSGLDDVQTPGLRTLMTLVRTRIFNPQTRRGSKVVAREHYDLGNDFFESMLDPAMQYSCACFEGTDDLAEAQERKLDLIARKLDLQEGMTLLDVGCGWGGLARHMAKKFGCRVVGITLSARQAAYAKELCQGLPVEIHLQDYRDVTGPFDRVVSVGMLEHVGEKNYRRYMESVGCLLASGGRFLCRSIGTNRSHAATDPWIARYIFPNSMLPTASQVTGAAEGIFVVEGLENTGPDYDRTLMAWERNFSASWDRFKDHYGERFERMWRYYLLGCAGAFRARGLQLFEFVFSKGGIPGGLRGR